MRPRATLLFLTLPLLALVAVGCQDTTDSLGSNEASQLHPLTKRTYPNVLHDVLGLSPMAITNKINMVYTQLFRSDVTAQGIYVGPGQTAGGWTAGSDEAFIYDVLHLQVRTEGIGLAMMIEVQLAQIAVPGAAQTTYQNEFDNLWRFTRRHLQAMGSETGYFNSNCDSPDGTTNTPCLDPYGLEQFVTALMFAHDLWSKSTGGFDYQTDALSLLHTIRFKQEDNGGVVGGVTNTFDSTTSLPFSFPDDGGLQQTRPSIVMPGYYHLWAEAANDPTFDTAATSGRMFWTLATGKAANKATGLLPVRATFAGDAVTGWAIFDPEAYRNQINMVIDQYWTGDTTGGPIVDKILAFFTSQGNYGTSYTIDGTCTNTLHETSLVVSNAIAAAIATTATSASDRQQYLSTFWNLATPTNNGRYYTGLLQLMGLLILSGQFQII